ncbi:APC family permease [Streptomyces sp. AC627_RSS907]|uniref:APC family permease n=1 Tax=Streptomyces sp. AC627_RSS907 TaxID=2823684 RepID=UPI001C245731|nr:APC family permease [Streptomyces sp. AC627_RSS907]
MSETSAGLAPKLSLTSVVAFGLSYMAPSLVMVLFGVIAAESAGTAPTAFLVATGAMCLTALSYAKMARHFPVSGSAYGYARNVLGGRAGFLVGWLVLLDYLFLPMVAWLVQSVYLNAQFPAIPVWAWMLLNAGLTTLVNIIGVSVADRVNKLLTALAVFLVLLFVAYCLIHLAGHEPQSYTAPLWNADSGLVGVSAAAAVAAYSYLGFDAVTTLSEETRDAHRTIPRAVVLVVAIGGLLFAAVAYIMQLVHPGGRFENPDIISYTMSMQVGGQTFADWANMATIIGGFASGLAVQLSSSRLLYSMGRDDVLPRRFFGALHPRTQTPVLSLLLTGAMCLTGLDIGLQTATSFINFGAFSAFTMVNVCVVVFYLRNRDISGGSLLGYVVVPALGSCVTVYLITQLSSDALTIGLTWLAAGCAYLLWLTRGFQRPIPELVLEDTAAPAR